jgi:hypothetical protein
MLGGDGFLPLRDQLDPLDARLDDMEIGDPALV